MIKTELESALRAGGHEPEVHEALIAAVEECDHLAQLAEDLLVLARSSDGRLPVRPQQLEARELLERVRDRFADRAAQRGRTIRVDAADGLRVEADGLRLSQALSNLVDNALRYGDGEWCCAEGAPARPSQLEVADSGAGLPAGAGRARLRALRPRRRARAPAAAPGSASRSCARSPRRTAARAEIVRRARRHGADLAPVPLDRLRAISAGGRSFARSERAEEATR